MSVAYSVLAMAFSLMGAASMKGSLTGRAAPPLHKGMSVLNAVGAVLFSNSAGIIVIDVSARRTWRAPRLRPAQFGGRGTLVGGEAACAERPPGELHPAAKRPLRFLAPRLRGTHLVGRRSSTRWQSRRTARLA